jgi:hypothetical protein
VSDIQWSELQQRTLAQLKHWEINPRHSNDDVRERLRKSKAKFSQTQPILIGPDDEIYDGHQRVNAWLEEFGGGLEVRVLVCSRKLTTAERQELTIVHHAGAVGDWNLPVLEAWGKDEQVLEWGFDAAAMDWFEDKSIVYENENEIWDGMPEYEQENAINTDLSINVHFASDDDIKAFAELLEQNITPKTTYIWYPKQEKLNLKEYRCVDGK